MSHVLSVHVFFLTRWDYLGNEFRADKYVSTFTEISRRIAFLVYGFTIFDLFGKIGERISTAKGLYVSILTIEIFT
jgi:hypothetical protein